MRLIDADKATKFLHKILDSIADKKLIWLSWEAVLEDCETIEPKTLLGAIALIKHFYENECIEHNTATIEVKKDGTRLRTDWGVFLGRITRNRKMGKDRRNIKYRKGSRRWDRRSS